MATRSPYTILHLPIARIQPYFPTIHCKPIRIRCIDRIIPDTRIQIFVPTLESNRIFTHPTANGRVVPAMEVVLEIGGLIEGAAGEGKQAVDGGVGLGLKVAVGVEGAMVDYRGG